MTVTGSFSATVLARDSSKSVERTYLIVRFNAIIQCLKSFRSEYGLFRQPWTGAPGWREKRLDFLWTAVLQLEQHP